MTDMIKRNAKAIIGAIIATLAALAGFLDDDALTIAEGITAAIAGLTALYGVWAIPNQHDDRQARHAIDTTRERAPYSDT